MDSAGYSTEPDANLKSARSPAASCQKSDSFPMAIASAASRFDSNVVAAATFIAAEAISVTSY